MTASLPLTLDELLTTTRAVRKRLDLTRPVDRHVIDECLTIAHQAPTASNMQNWHFLVVTDPTTRATLADIYRRGWATYLTQAYAAPNLTFADPSHTAMQGRVTASATYLAAHLHEVPVLVVPCIVGRTDGQDMVIQSALWGTIAPAMWNFMLAARARGLGTCWTCVHLFYERDAAAALGIPYDEVMQAGLIPVAYTQGTAFKTGWRKPLETTVHWEKW
jgi:nitroreductase